MQDHIQHLALVSKHIRRVARRHLAEKTANRPPIDRLPIRRGCAEHFGRHVVVGSAHAVVAHGVVVDRDIGGVRIRRFLLAIIADAEVAENDVSFAVQKDVLGLDVAVDDAARVQVFDGENDFGYVKTSYALGKKKGIDGVLLRKSPCRRCA